MDIDIAGEWITNADLFLGHTDAVACCDQIRGFDHAGVTVSVADGGGVTKGPERTDDGVKNDNNRARATSGLAFCSIKTPDIRASVKACLLRNMYNSLESTGTRYGMAPSHERPLTLSRLRRRFLL